MVARLAIFLATVPVVIAQTKIIQRDRALEFRAKFEHFQRLGGRVFDPATLHITDA